MRREDFMLGERLEQGCTDSKEKESEENVGFAKKIVIGRGRCARRTFEKRRRTAEKKRSRKKGRGLDGQIAEDRELGGKGREVVGKCCAGSANIVILRRKSSHPCLKGKGSQEKSKGRSEGR